MTRRDDAVRDLLDRAEARFRAVGVPAAAHDAQALLEHASGLTRSQLSTLRTPCPSQVPGVETFETYVARRVAREPLQHITGWAYFRHAALAVGPGVFVPRPETEVVAQAAIDAARSVSEAGRVAVVVDLGTGSGAIARSVVDEVPGARVHAAELDPAAYAWAERNLAGTAVDLRLGDMADAFPELDGTVDVVVSNPPYIPLGASVRDPEVLAHDPAVALWSGEDGLDAVRVVERVAARLLRPGGLAVVEHADAQGEAVPAVFLAAERWRGIADSPDLAGRDRFTTARRSPDR
jgi:release factor glutamine methyltransferase